MINQTPTLPSPHVPRSLGAAIHQTYETGEWVANITADSVAIWYPDKASGTYKTFVHGNASAIGINGKYTLNVDSTSGMMTGRVSFLAADYSMNPEVYGILQLALESSSPTQVPATFDDAMKTGKVWLLETCPEGGSPSPTPPLASWTGQ